jgi:hypothetical protein
VLIPIEIELKPAPDDPAINTPEFQKELREFSAALSAAGVNFSQRAVVFDSVDAHGYSLAEFVLRALQAGALPTVATIIVAYFQRRNGRKARLKYGNVEAESNSVEEIERLLQLVPSLPPDAEKLEMKRQSDEADLKRRAQAFSVAIAKLSTEELFRTFHAIGQAKKTAVIGNGEGESEDLIFKGAVAEVEIIKRHPKEWMAAYHNWEKSQP